MSHTLLWKRLLIWGVCLLGIFLALPNAFYPTVERHNDAAAILAETGALPEAAQADLEGWPNWLPSDLVALGLLVLSVAAAWFTWRFVEEPCRKWSRRRLAG